MIQDEFEALRVGDKIDNPMTQSSGVVTETDAAHGIVTVRWGDKTPGNDVTFNYHVRMTAWKHWTLSEPPADDAATIGTGP